MLPDPPTRQVQSVRQAFEILHIIQEYGGATPAQITEQLDISKSSVHNYMSTLEILGYVVNESGIYRLGLRSLTHGVGAMNTVNIRRFSGIVDGVAREFSMLTWLVTEELGRGYFLDRSTTDGVDEIYGTVGKRSYLHTHGPGKAILATLSDEDVQKVIDLHGLPAHTIRTVGESDALFADLAEVREQGFATSEGESVLDIFSIGVAFRDVQNRVHAIGVFGYSRDFAGDRPTTVGTNLRDTVHGLVAQTEQAVL